MNVIKKLTLNDEEVKRLAESAKISMDSESWGEIFREITEQVRKQSADKDTLFMRMSACAKIAYFRGYLHGMRTLNDTMKIWWIDAENVINAFFADETEED